MIRKIAVVATAALIAAGATACEGGGGQQDSGPSGVIFMPMPGVPGAGMPIFF
ncbi:hypothetical protein SEA_ALISHAPH_52 [Mycobacterium phage AlishaPH]|uniref:Lipoprotein n=1 Tax=Mycobacterium phage AlishaPH TaxID=2163590 RepID=A0A2S1PAR8_9CAUD|nr:hypothetical protein I5G91_gp42 [Mycobacterium phage AlishaPH]AWH13665.1 hypothetical protein SEA_ALISHAPH_52 [Mycobacterium phage AlishaPH]